MKYIEQNNECRDMLLRLYELPNISSLVEKLKSEGITIRRALVPEKHIVINWVKEQFGNSWADECDMGFIEHPVHCFIATIQNKIIGISVYNAIALGTVGPLGIAKEFRGAELGKALFIEMLHDMRRQGYSYAILGWISPKKQKYFQRIVNAEVLERTSPHNGMYNGLLIEQPLNNG